MLGVHVAVARDPYPNEDEAGDSGQNARRNTFITGRTGSTSSTAMRWMRWRLGSASGR
jgi:hypothetical protein